MKKSRSVLRFLLLLAASGCFAIAAGALAIYLYLAPKLPSVEALREIELQTPLKVYTADGVLMAEFGEKKRTPITFDQVPKNFINALLAAEDENFYTHPGIDVKGLARAVFELITTGKKRSGGSTITMQVAKNYYLSSEKSFTRKLTEILLALHIEKAMSKQEILELYVNKIYLGKRAYGIEAAAQIYYGKHIGELNLAQLAMVAGLPQAPSAANPINNPDRAIHRRNYVLARMYAEDYITQEEFEAAIREPLTAKLHNLDSEVEAPYVAEMVRSYIVDLYGEDAAYTRGYKVYTTILSKNQFAAQRAVREGLHQYDREHGLRMKFESFKDLISTDEQNQKVKETSTNWNEDMGQPASDTFLPLPPSPMDLNAQYWREQMADLPTLGTMQWAGVMQVGEKSAEVILSDGTKVTLDWQAMSWARKYLDTNSAGPSPKSASDVLKVGNKILVMQNKDRWYLAQEPAVQGALVSFDPQNGSLLALVGGYDFQQSSYNRAIQADRQPGSAFKPFIYSAAMENGLTPASLINDAPVVFENDSLEAAWRPENYTGEFFGPTRLRQALYNSRNLVSIRILRSTGITKTVKYISQLGLPEEKLSKDLSLALGSSAMTPYELATGYTVLANGGFKVQPNFIAKIESLDGKELLKNTPQIVCQPCWKSYAQLADPADTSEKTTPDAANFQARYPGMAPRVMDERTNYLLYSMLQDVIREGTGQGALVLRRSDLAGKTGTTNEQKDTWFSGFNNKIVTTVWVGFDNPQSLGRNSFGGTTALPIWVDYMSVALSTIPESPLPRPDGLVTLKIDPETGLKAYPGQDNAIFEIFKEEDVPAETAEPKHGNLQNGGGTDEQAPEQLF